MNNLEIERLLNKVPILFEIRKAPFLNDEPKLFNFSAKLDLQVYKGDGNSPDLYSGGTSQNKKIALYKAIFEAYERYSLSYFKFKSFYFGTYKQLSSKSSAVRPISFKSFTDTQLKQDNFKDFSFSSNEKFYWTKCRDLNTSKVVYLPSQLIYTPYKFTLKEKVLRLPISTGTALSGTFQEALYKAICEVIERDAYSTSYLLRLSPHLIQYSSYTNRVKKMIDICEKYKLEIKSFILNSDLEIPTVMSILIDDTGHGPAISIGLKTDWDIENAIVGSIEESYQSRIWIRGCMMRKDFSGGDYTTSSMLTRAKFWSQLKNKDKLSFFLKIKKTVFLSKNELVRGKKLSIEEKLEKVKKVLGKNNLQVYYKDITYNPIKKYGLFVIKCVIPSLHPMYIDKDFKYLTGHHIEKLKRKNNISKLNLLPQPFL